MLKLRFFFNFGSLATAYAFEIITMSEIVFPWSLAGFCHGLDLNEIHSCEHIVLNKKGYMDKPSQSWSKLGLRLVGECLRFHSEASSFLIAHILFYANTPF